MHKNETLQIDNTLKGAEIILHMITFQTVQSIVRLSSRFPGSPNPGGYGISFDIMCEISYSFFQIMRRALQKRSQYISPNLN